MEGATNAFTSMRFIGKYAKSSIQIFVKLIILKAIKKGIAGMDKDAKDYIWVLKVQRPYLKNSVKSNDNPLLN